jgi:hypothetical protein
VHDLQPDPPPRRSHVLRNVLIAAALVPVVAFAAVAAVRFGEAWIPSGHSAAASPGAAPAAAPAASSSLDGEITGTCRPAPQYRPADGSTGTVISVSVTNIGQTPIQENGLAIAYFAQDGSEIASDAQLLPGEEIQGPVVAPGATIHQLLVTHALEGLGALGSWTCKVESYSS